MNNFKSLTVFGCSFSDYMNGELHRVYGDYLAEHMGVTYQHQARGGGSNYAMWRRCHEMYAAGELDNGLIIIQYTEPMRQEFFVNRLPYNSWNRPADHQWPRAHNEDPWGDGTVIRWKMGADQWQNTHRDRDFFRMYQAHYVNEAWAQSQFAWHHSQFCAWIKSVGLTVMFLQCRILPQFELAEPWATTAFRDPWEQLTAAEYRYEPDDFCHMNDLGHRTMAGQLLTHVRQHFGSK